MVLFRNKPIIMTGKMLNVEFTADVLKKAKFPDKVPLVKEWDDREVWGQASNFHWDNYAQAIVGDIEVHKVLPFIGYGPQLELLKWKKGFPQEISAFRLKSVSLVKQPMHAKFKLRRINTKRRLGTT